MAVDLTAADPAAIGIAHLLADPAVTVALGGPGRVGSRNSPPFPRLRVLDVPGGDDRALRWLISAPLQVEAYGDQDGLPGKAALRRILYVALQSLERLPRVPVGPYDPVVTAVQSRGGGGWSPEPSGQPRYVATVLLTLHPPVAERPA